MLQARWDRPSTQWIRGLRQFADLLYPQVEIAVAKTLRAAVRAGRANIPVFDGDLQRDLQMLGIPRRLSAGRGLRLRGSVGFTDATVQPADESNRGPSPFAIGLGKHSPSPAAGSHGVYLYHPSGGSSKGRAKLVKWMKKHGGPEYQSLPDAPSKDDVEKWQAAVEQSTGVKPKPFVQVDPSLTATDFLWALVEDDGDPLMSELIAHVALAVERVWQRGPV